MNKRLVIVFILILICILCVGLSACSTKNGNVGNNYTTITYYLYEDSPPITFRVFDSKVSLSVIPTRAHYRFLGLFDAKVGGSKIVDENGVCNIVIDKSMTLWAQWQPNECKIFFDAGNGTLDKDKQTMNLIYGSSISFVPVPQYEGYDFVGWTSGNGLVSSEGMILSEKTLFNEDNYKFGDKSDNVTLKAEYRRKEFKITLDFNDGSYQSEEIPVYYGDTLDEIDFPERDNGSQIIVNWSIEKNHYVEYKDKITSNMTLYAIWKDYKTFKFYVGEDECIEQRVFRGEEYVIPDPERIGYEFDGWYSSNIFVGNPIDRVTYGSAVTSYYAKWIPIEYEISFVTNGGNKQLDNIKYTIEDYVELPDAGLKDYCVFLGWCKYEDLSDRPQISLSKGSYGNLKLYAKWRGEEKSVILNAKEGQILNSARKVEYGAQFNLGVPKYDGYEFQGWYTASDIRMTDKNGQSLQPWSIASEPTTLYAKYLKKYYINITYSHENAGVVEVDKYYLSGVNVSLSINLIDKGYEIIGFYSNGNLVAEGSEYKFTMPQENVDLNVAFKAKEINITLNSNGGHLSENYFTIIYKDKFSLPVAYKQGYLFNGWKYNGKAVTDGNGNGLSSWNIASDVELFADYVEDPDAKNKSIIYDAKTLLGIANAPSKTYIVVEDIDMQGIVWNPFNFSGELNGNGFKIKNLSISSSSGNLGMFLQLSGTVKNLVFENVEIASTSYNSVNIGAVSASLTGTVENVEIRSGKLTSDIADIGGIVGYMSAGSIKNCTNRAEIDGNKADTTGTSGGIVGWFIGGTVENCKNYGNIIGKHNTAGIVGGISKSANACIKESINYGTVNGKIYTGGIIGSTANINAIVNVTNEGMVTGTDYTAGIVGKFGDFSGNVTINTNLINRGTVAGKNYVGGIVGELIDTADLNQFSSPTYTVAISRVTNSGNVTGEIMVGGIFGRIYARGTNKYSTKYCNIKITASSITNTGNITGVSQVGGLVGYGYSNDASSTLNGCTSSGSVVAEYYVGGLAGKIENVKMIECNNENSTVSATGYYVDGTTYYAYVGGFAGYGYAFESCNNAVEITYTERGQYVGGIAGYANGAFANCTNTAKVAATNGNYVGGIAGRMNYSGDINLTAITNQGEITGKDYVGGIVGDLNDTADLDQFSSPTYTVAISRLTNGGNVTGETMIGGIFGRIYARGTNKYSTKYCNIKITASSIINTGNITGVSQVGGLVGYGYSNDASSLIVGFEASGTVSGSGESVGQIVGKVENIKLDE